MMEKTKVTKLYNRMLFLLHPLLMMVGTTLPDGGRRLYLCNSDVQYTKAVLLLGVELHLSRPNKKSARATIMRMAGRPKAQG